MLLKLFHFLVLIKLIKLQSANDLTLFSIDSLFLFQMQMQFHNSPVPSFQLASLLALPFLFMINWLIFEFNDKLSARRWEIKKGKGTQTTSWQFNFPGLHFSTSTTVAAACLWLLPHGLRNMQILCHNFPQHFLFLSCCCCRSRLW